MDDVKEQIKPQTNPYWHCTKKTLKFVWRHFFTIPPAFFLILSVLIMKEDAIIIMSIWTIWAVIFDHAKCNRASWGTHRHNRSNDDHLPLNIRESWNPARVGSAAYFIDQAGKI